MSWLSVGKLAANFITSASVSLVVKNLVVATTPKDLGKLNKLLVGVGGLIISSMVADQACKYVEQEVDELINSFQPKQVEIPTLDSIGKNLAEMNVFASEKKP